MLDEYEGFKKDFNKKDFKKRACEKNWIKIDK